MSAAFPPFPEDPEQLRARLAEMAALLERQNSALVSLMLERDGLAAERDHFKAAYEEAEAERRRLDQVLQQLRRAQSGPKSERLDPDQFQLALENVEQDLAAAAAAREEAAAGNPGEARRKRRAPAKRLLGHLPRHLEREEIRIEPADTTCPCCGGAMHEIATETSERLHVIPMKLRVRVTVRPKYGCRSCAGAVVQAPAARFPAACPPKRCSPTSRWPSSRTDCRSTGNVRSSPATASRWTARRWPTGSAGRHGG